MPATTHMISGGNSNGKGLSVSGGKPTQAPAVMTQSGAMSKPLQYGSSPEAGLRVRPTCHVAARGRRHAARMRKPRERVSTSRGSRARGALADALSPQSLPSGLI